MYTVTRMVTATPEQVWAVLKDGWSYASWVVGASRMRAVGADWPAVGARLHHSAGVWPAVVNDETEVLESDPPRRLLLQAKGWPAGEATIELRIERAGDGCKITMIEDATRGPGRFVPKALAQPAIAVRNAETLRRLAYMAEGRTSPRADVETSQIHPGGGG